jgi:predicted DNA-binding transcriptional regulator AlpA
MIDFRNLDIRNLPNKHVLRRSEVKRRTGLKDTALDAAIARNEFPPALKVTPGGRTRVWLEYLVDLWLEARLAALERELAIKRQAQKIVPPIEIKKPAVEHLPSAAVSEAVIEARRRGRPRTRPRARE